VVVDAQRRAPGAETEIRTTPMFSKRFRSDKGSDPIAELARLIAQADRCTPSDSRSREETVLDGYDEMPELPPAPQLAVDLNEENVSDGRDETPELPLAPQLAVDLNADDQASERDKRCSDDQVYVVDDDLFAGEEEYQNSVILHYAVGERHQGKEVSGVRRHSLTLAIAVFGLALVGTVCAVGYRDMLGGPVSSTPPRGIQTINERNTIASVSGPQGANSGKPREVDPTITGSIDNTVPREDRPTAVRPSKAAPRASLPLATVTTGSGQTAPNRAVPRAAVAVPAPRLTVAAAPEGPTSQSGGENDIAVSNHQRLATDPLAHASSDTSAAAAAVASSYAVQVTSERSESRAQAAFRALQAKYPNQLGGHQPIIRRADLGAAGIYYRALVGPFALAKKAAKLCRTLKAAGGNCIVQKMDGRA
jgi:SPOR domain